MGLTAAVDPSSPEVRLVCRERHHVYKFDTTPYFLGPTSNALLKNLVQFHLPTSVPPSRLVSPVS